ncbi:hypothetical protein Salat_1904700 [Sesamum alatum]|uniref:Uncharacterized protein n=1 Tax=Sesamum alatum TaxID=300844 RepID=A0AAE1Y3T9_9LAMI|nr:hypothetical protein Salat_1904700 [Sesamum alatum]
MFTEDNQENSTRQKDPRTDIPSKEMLRPNDKDVSSATHGYQQASHGSEKERSPVIKLLILTLPAPRMGPQEIQIEIPNLFRHQTAANNFPSLQPGPWRKGNLTSWRLAWKDQEPFTRVILAHSEPQTHKK